MLKYLAIGAHGRSVECEAYDFAYASTWQRSMADFSEPKRTRVETRDWDRYIQEPPIDDPYGEGLYGYPSEDDEESECNRGAAMGPAGNEEVGDYEVPDACLIVLPPKESVDEAEGEEAELEAGAQSS
jgi:hypothetical protein